MATNLLTVEDVFDIASRGLVIVPGPLANGALGALRLPYQPVAAGFKELTPF